MITKSSSLEAKESWEIATWNLTRYWAGKADTFCFSTKTRNRVKFSVSIVSNSNFTSSKKLKRPHAIAFWIERKLRYASNYLKTWVASHFFLACTWFSRQKNAQLFHFSKMKGLKRSNFSSLWALILIITNSYCFSLPISKNGMTERFLPRKSSTS